MSMIVGNRRALLGGRPKPLLQFQKSLVDFTPAMAVRAGTVFAGAPIVQGHFDGTGTGDLLSAPRGDLTGVAASLFYDNFDPNQGTIVVTGWVPETDRTAGRTNDEFLWRISPAYYLRYEHDTQTLFAYCGARYYTAALTTVAGDLYCVTVSYDCKKPIDGTNYIRISVDDAHDYGATTKPTASAPPTAMYVGNNAGFNPSNALLEGIFYFRRVLWDGLYGTDVNGGIDEIALISAGVDPCAIAGGGGSWDCVFGLPTDSTPAALVTGEGNAWSHPHDSEIEQHAFLDDGFNIGATGWGVFYDKLDTDATVTDNAPGGLQDLPNGAAGFTIGTWMRPDSWGEASSAHFLSKYGSDPWAGYSWGLDSANGIFAHVYCATSAADTVTGTDGFTPDGKWHYFTLFFEHSDQGGDCKAYLAVDGKWEGSYTTQVAGVGAYASDVGLDLHIGNSSPAPSHTQDGVVGWSALWADDHHVHGTDFIPPSVAPVAGGTLVEAWHFNEGTGNAAAAQITTPGNDCALVYHVWEEQWDQAATPLTPTYVEFDGAATGIIVTASAEFQDLPDGAFTADIEFRADSYGEASVGVFLHKLVGDAGWACSYSLGSIGFRVNCLTDDSVASYAFVPDKQWHSMRLTFDDAGDRKARIYFDGILVDTGDAGNGAYQSDADIDLGIGCSQAGSASFDGAIGRVRLCNVLRSATTVTAFVPDARTNAPGVDANSVLQIDMTDGAGAVATDSAAGANHGAITAGAGGWLVTHDMATDAPGARYGHGGYVFGADAAHDGFKQTLAGLAAGSNYVFRVPVHWGADSRGQPEIVVYDETNGAAISTFLGPKMVATHDGGDDSATLIDADGKFRQSQVGMTLYNITDGSKTVVTAVSGDGTTVTGVLAGGTGNDWDDGDVGRFVWTGGFARHPWCETFTCELPTNARNGVASDCISASVQGLNAAAEGTLYWHDLEWLTVLDDGPSLETGAVANPFIPDGWTNVDLDAGDTVQEVTIVHSGAASLEFDTGASAEGIRQQITAAIGDFVQVGLWSYCDGSAGFTIGGLNATQLRVQYSATVFNVATPHTAVWSYTTAVFRVVAANPSIYILADAGAAGARYVDDVVVTITNPVSLTCTPRSLANSVELGGLSIDGYDTLTQPTGRLTRTHGEIRFSAIPRHDMDEVGEWGSTAEYLVDLYIDANNRLLVRREVTPRLFLSVESNGATLTDTWNTAWAAAAVWGGIVRWNPARVWVLVNGAEVLSVAWASVFTADPATVYFGSDYLGANQFDGVILP